MKSAVRYLFYSSRYSSLKFGKNHIFRRFCPQVDMLRIGMLLSCIFMTNSVLDERGVDKSEMASMDLDKYSVTCYICVNVSDNPVCNQFAIDRPCKTGKPFFITLMK